MVTELEHSTESGTCELHTILATKPRKRAHWHLLDQALLKYLKNNFDLWLALLLVHDASQECVRCIELDRILVHERKLLQLLIIGYLE